MSTALRHQSVDRFYMCAVGLVSSRPQTHMWVPHLDLEAPPGSLSLGLTPIPVPSMAVAEEVMARAESRAAGWRRAFWL